MIVGIVLVQVLVAGIVLINRGSSDEPSAEERATVESSLRQGSAAQTNGEVEVAEKAYDQVLELDPNNKVALYNLGVLEEGKGPESRAEEYYLRALEVDPDFVPALFNLAVRRDAEGRPQEAANLYRRVISLEPSMATAHLNLGFVLLRKLGQKEEGKAELLKAIVLDSSLASRIPPEELYS